MAIRGPLTGMRGRAKSAHLQRAAVFPVSRSYAILDVFTETALAGNQLAVVLDCDGLDEAQMQAIAREFNLSETVFVMTPADTANTAALRIFTPARELPFAGHPTVGCGLPPKRVSVNTSSV